MFSVVLQYMFGALADCVPPIVQCKHLESPQKLLDSFDKEINAQFKEVGPWGVDISQS